MKIRQVEQIDLAPIDKHRRIQDAHLTVCKAIREKWQDLLKIRWRAHMNLDLREGQQKLTLTPEVVTALLIMLKKSGKQRQEITFYFVEKKGRVHFVTEGEIGDDTKTYVGVGDVRGLTTREAERVEGEVGAGHIHLSGYGPIFSDRVTSYGPAGLDHHTVFSLQKSLVKMSPYHMILAHDSHTNLPVLGIWKAEEPTVAIIHPWQEEKQGWKIWPK